jgi:hypothetical protein
MRSRPGVPGAMAFIAGVPSILTLAAFLPFLFSVELNHD